MPRKKRVVSKTGYYHVVMRGQNRDYIFKTDTLKRYFMANVMKIQEEEDVVFIAWCIMDNHVHLVVKVEADLISKVFKRLNVKFAMFYHKKNETLGHVFQDRYKSVPIETDESLLNVIRYVHQNPYKAKLIVDLSKYKWSSYSFFLKGSLNEEQKLVMKIFGDLESYIRFHQEEDDREYLDIKEDQLNYRQEKAKKIINEFCYKNSIQNIQGINEDKNKFKELLIEVIEKCSLSQRQIAKELRMPISSIQKVCKDLK